MTIARRRAREGDDHLVVGSDGKQRPNRRLDAEMLEERDTAIVTWRMAGSSIREIAAMIGCSVGTVHRVLKQQAHWLPAYLAQRA